MNLSKLIPVLQHIYDNYGDLDVEREDSEYDAETVVSVEVHDGGTLGKTVQLSASPGTPPSFNSKTMAVWSEESGGVAWAERPSPPPDVQFRPWSD